MGAMLGDDEETADDREQDEYLLDSSAYYALKLVHVLFVVGRQSAWPQCDSLALRHGFTPS